MYVLYTVCLYINQDISPLIDEGSSHKQLLDMYQTETSPNYNRLLERRQVLNHMVNKPQDRNLPTKRSHHNYNVIERVQSINEPTAK